MGPESLSGQLVLDLPGLNAPAERPAARRRPRPVVEELPAVLGVPAMPPRVWGVWVPAETRAVLPPADRLAAALDASTLPGAATAV